MAYPPMVFLCVYLCLRSGKTYTMTGGEGFAERGLVPRAIHDVFKEIKVKI